MVTLNKVALYLTLNISTLAQRRYIMANMKSHGKSSLLPSRFSGRLWILVWLRIDFRTPSAKSLKSVNVSRLFENVPELGASLLVAATRNVSQNGQSLPRLEYVVSCPSFNLLCYYGT